MRDWLLSVRVEGGGSNREHRAPCVCLLVCHAVLLVVGCEPLSQSCTSADCDIPFGVQFAKSSAWATGVYRHPSTAHWATRRLQSAFLTFCLRSGFDQNNFSVNVRCPMRTPSLS